MATFNLLCVLAICALASSLSVPKARPVKKPEPQTGSSSEASLSAPVVDKPAPVDAAPKPAPISQGFPGASVAFPGPVAPVVQTTATITTTITVFGPVATEMITEMVTATQMINAGTTQDIRITDTTNYDIDLLATVISRVYVPRPAEVSTSVVTAEVGGPGEVITSLGVVSDIQSVTITDTVFTTSTILATSTHTLEHFSTAIEVEIIPIMMTTTIYEVSTRTKIAVARETTTIFAPNPYY